MSDINKYDYDVVIIGAGIGGLVCGCYLAKAGFKTLIVEKNAKPGGYCTSFTRNGFHFDACVHSLGSLREGGNIWKVLKELDLLDRLKIIRHDPSDVVISSDMKISFWNNLDKTIKELQEKFPKDANGIKTLFHYMNNVEGLSLVKLRNKTFKDVLDLYLKDSKLKAFLGLPILGNAGLSFSRASALTAIFIYKEFMFDGGYYPERGMHALPDLLVKKLKELGGNILLSQIVKKIKINEKVVKGVILDGGVEISAKYVISNADVRQTFFDMIGKENIKLNISDKLDNMLPSLSMFALYLGIDKSFKSLPEKSQNIWFLPHYDVEKMYNTAINGEVDKLDWFLTRLSSDERSLLFLVNAPYRDEKYWLVNKRMMIDIFIKRLECVIPNLSSHIILRDAATPSTLYRWTLNFKGAAYGWAGIPSQFAIPELSQISYIKNLYFTGHWVTLAQGVSGVTHLGRDTAKLILDKEGKRS